MKPLFKLHLHHLLALVLIIIQAAVLDYYLVVYNQQIYGLAFLGWIAGDLVVIFGTITAYVMGVRYITAYFKAHPDADSGEEVPPTAPNSKGGPLAHLGILPFAWIGWVIYSLVLCGKILSIFQTFGNNLTEENLPGINVLEFTLGGTAAIFMLTVGGVEELATSAQKHYLRWMEHYVLLEIVDCVEFLTVLFVAAELGPEKGLLPAVLQNFIMTFACINLVAPAHALYRLSSVHNRHAEIRNRFYLTQTLVGTVFGNVPYFCIRVYLWNQHNFVTGLFAMKNLIGIVTDGQEVLEYLKELLQKNESSEAHVKNVPSKYEPVDAKEMEFIDAAAPETRLRFHDKISVE